MISRLSARTSRLSMEDTAILFLAAQGLLLLELLHLSFLTPSQIRKVTERMLQQVEKLRLAFGVLDAARTRPRRRPRPRKRRWVCSGVLSKSEPRSKRVSIIDCPTLFFETDHPGGQNSPQTKFEDEDDDEDENESPARRQPPTANREL